MEKGEKRRKLKAIEKSIFIPFSAHPWKHFSIAQHQTTVYQTVQRRRQDFLKMISISIRTLELWSGLSSSLTRNLFSPASRRRSSKDFCWGEWLRERIKCWQHSTIANHSSNTSSVVALLREKKANKQVELSLPSFHRPYRNSNNRTRHLSHQISILMLLIYGRPLGKVCTWVDELSIEEGKGNKKKKNEGNENSQEAKHTSKMKKKPWWSKVFAECNWISSTLNIKLFVNLLVYTPFPS